MEIFVKTTKEMKRIGKGPETEAENNYLRMLSYDFATLFPQLCGLWSKMQYETKPEVYAIIDTEGVDKRGLKSGWAILFIEIISEIKYYSPLNHQFF